MESRFLTARTIAGTHRLHSVRPISTDLVEVKEFSASQDARVERVSNATGLKTRVLDIAGYITAKYDGQWWLGYVMETHQDLGEVKLSFLHPHGPSRSFVYPSKPDILVMSSEDILTVVNPTTATGRAYALSEQEMIIASKELHK